MPVGTTGGGSAAAAAPAAAPLVPFLAGSYEYSEPITTLVVTPGSSEQDFVQQITPGGFLRGVTINCVGTGGVIGSGVLSTDAPWIIFANLSMESIDGTPLLYPKGGYAEYIVSKCTRPWDGDPAQDPQFVNGINPVFNLRYFIESRMTLGCLPNTDARAQYRLRLGVSPSSLIFTTAPTTVPTLTFQIYLETYAQPPATDYAGNAIAQLPDGLIVQRFTSHELPVVNAGDQVLKSNRVGNLIRTEILIVRNNSTPATRAALTADPIRWRLDNTQLLNEQRQRRTYENDRWYQFGQYNQAGGGNGSVASAFPTGVYVYPRFHNPGDMDGMYWLPTTEATYLAWELTPPAGGVEIITEDLAPAGQVPSYLMGL